MMDRDERNTPSLYRMSRRSRVSLLRTHSPTTFPEGTGIQKILTNPIARIQVDGRQPDQSISLVYIYYCAPSLGSLEDRRGYCYDSLHSLFHYSTRLYGHLFFHTYLYYLLIHAYSGTYSCTVCTAMHSLCTVHTRPCTVHVS